MDGEDTVTSKRKSSPPHDLHQVKSILKKIRKNHKLEIKDDDKVDFKI
jgi:hypothetical protein